MTTLNETQSQIAEARQRIQREQRIQEEARRRIEEAQRRATSAEALRATSEGLNAQLRRRQLSSGIQQAEANLATRQKAIDRFSQDIESTSAKISTAVAEQEALRKDYQTALKAIESGNPFILDSRRSRRFYEQIQIGKSDAIREGIQEVENQLQQTLTPELRSKIAQELSNTQSSVDVNTRINRVLGGSRLPSVDIPVVQTPQIQRLSYDAPQLPEQLAPSLQINPKTGRPYGVLNRAPTRLESYNQYIQDRNIFTRSLDFLGQKIQGQISGDGFEQVARSGAIPRATVIAPFLIPQTAAASAILAGGAQFLPSGQREVKLQSQELSQRFPQISEREAQIGINVLGGAQIALGGVGLFSQLKKGSLSSIPEVSKTPRPNVNVPNVNVPNVNVPSRTIQQEIRLDRSAKNLRGQSGIGRTQLFFRENISPIPGRLAATALDVGSQVTGGIRNVGNILQGRIIQANPLLRAPRNPQEAQIFSRFNRSGGFLGTDRQPNLFFRTVRDFAGSVTQAGRRVVSKGRNVRNIVQGRARQANPGFIRQPRNPAEAKTFEKLQRDTGFLGQPREGNLFFRAVKAGEDVAEDALGLFVGKAKNVMNIISGRIIQANPAKVPRSLRREVLEAERFNRQTGFFGQPRGFQSLFFRERQAIGVGIENFGRELRRGASDIINTARGLYFRNVNPFAFGNRNLNIAETRMFLRLNRQQGFFGKPREGDLFFRAVRDVKRGVESSTGFIRSKIRNVGNILQGRIIQANPLLRAPRNPQEAQIFSRFNRSGGFLGTDNTIGVAGRAIRNVRGSLIGAGEQLAGNVRNVRNILQGRSRQFGEKIEIVRRAISPARSFTRQLAKKTREENKGLRTFILGSVANRRPVVFETKITSSDAPPIISSRGGQVQQLVPQRTISVFQGTGLYERTELVAPRLSFKPMTSVVGVSSAGGSASLLDRQPASVTRNPRLNLSQESSSQSPQIRVQTKGQDFSSLTGQGSILQSQGNILETPQTQRQPSRFVSLARSLLRSQQAQRQKTGQIQKPFSRSTTKQKVPVAVGILNIPETEGLKSSSSSLSNEEDTFEVFTKRFGRNFKILEGQNLLSLVRKGSRAVDQTLARSIFVRRKGSEENIDISGFLGPQFRRSKSKSRRNVFVERSAFALDTGSERRNIQFFRKRDSRRRGWF